MKMKTGRRTYVLVTDIKKLKELFQENNCKVKIILTRKMCILGSAYGREQKNSNAIFFDYNGYLSQIHTATAWQVIAENSISANGKTVYYCERKENKLIAEEIKKKIEYDENLNINTPFSLSIEKIPDAHFNQLLNKHPEIVAFFKEGNS